MFVRTLIARTMVAATIALGLTVGSAGLAHATIPSHPENYRPCKQNRGPGSALECCINNGGEPMIDKATGKQIACRFPGSATSSAT